MFDSNFQNRPRMSWGVGSEAEETCDLIEVFEIQWWPTKWLSDFILLSRVKILFGLILYSHNGIINNGVSKQSSWNRLCGIVTVELIASRARMPVTSFTHLYTFRFPYSDLLFSSKRSSIAYLLSWIFLYFNLLCVGFKLVSFF